MKVTWPNNVFGNAYCSSPHPDHREGDDAHATVFCRMPRAHSGDHAAYIFSIKAPETWPA